jgi:hypothetical protein
VSRIYDAFDEGFTFFTSYLGKTADVQRRIHHSSKRKYLTTNPDDYKENNLDYLGVCPNGTPNAT